MERLALVAYDLNDSHTPSTPWTNGSRVATATGGLAILRAGGLDHYDILLPSDEPGAAQSYLRALEEHSVDIRRVTVVPLQRIPAALSRTPYLAVHDPTSPLLCRLSSIVEALAVERTPTTAVHFSISYIDLIPHFTSACAMGLPIYSSLFCTSMDSLEAQRRMLDHLCDMIGKPAGAWGHRLDLVPLGTEVPDHLLPVDDARRLLQLPTDVPIVLYLGRLSPFDKADLDVLLRAFARVVTSLGGAPMLLVVAGDDLRGYSRSLRVRAQELGINTRLHVLGNISAMTKGLLYRSATVFVSPADSVQESFGLAIIEAMAHAVPVIVSDWGGYRDLVRHGSEGFLLPTLRARCDADVDFQAEFGIYLSDHLALGQTTVVDEAALVRSLTTVIQSPDMRSRMAHAAQLRAREYAWPRIVSRYEQLWRQLKEIASALPHRPRQVAARLQFSEAFSHYPSHVVRGDERIWLAHAAPGVAPMPQLDHDPERMQALRARLGNGPRMVKEVVASGAELRALMWLIKYGVVIMEPITGREHESGAI